MLETTRFESRQRLPGAVVIALAMSAFAGMMVLIAPGIIGDVDIQALIERLPPSIVEQFRLAEMGTIEGFLGIEFYQFLWLIGFAAYVAYSAGSSIAGDIETARMDTLLAAPISRWRLLIEKYLALLTPILVVNIVVFGAVYGGFLLIDEPVSVWDLAMVHLLSMPYLLTAAAWGVLVSVLISRRLIAEGVAAGGIIGAFLMDAALSGSPLSWLGGLAPMRYYDPLSILTAGEYDLTGAVILFVAALCLLLASIWRFQEVDIE